ncbi:hypothetical protein NDU88_004313 [Pleurodeles waltl]|uniref:Uncharacterized protein n=1 Tax=Pleurodeles waltl TaxID=8319 RepID=A0AAV7VIH7_PLEWA|nr:hypothetical protein NDU88_004313 [Pleurodeles waltl]
MMHEINSGNMQRNTVTAFVNNRKDKIICVEDCDTVTGRQIRPKADFVTKGRVVQLMVVFVAESGPPILGWQHQYDLHIIINPRAPNQIMVVEEMTIEEIIDGAKAVFSENVSEPKGYIHEIVVMKGVVPVQHTLRRVPVVVREENKKIIEDMVAKGIIEPVQCSEWVSPGVTTKKSDESLRFCMDFRSVNQNIVTVNFPLLL